MMKQKLPLLVLYEHQESWYVEDDKPIAIFLEPDKYAVSAINYPKMQFGFAKRLCEDADIYNLYWQIPNNMLLQKMLDYRLLIDETAVLIHGEKFHNSRYWGRDKVTDDSRLGLHMGLEREQELPVYQHAYLRPFLRL